MNKPSVVLTIGVFDGMHLGHRALVRETVRCAHRLRVLPAALTFTNHPLNVLHHEGKVAFLYPRRETYRELQKAGIRRLLRVPFTVRFSRRTPEQFIRRLERRFDLRAVVVGGDFRFGANNRGDVTTLKRLGRKYGFQVLPVVLKGVAAAKISSSLIRRALAAGRVEAANRMLGRPFHITGRVEKGCHVGHKLGYPTANLTRLECFVPRNGIYACAVTVGGRTYRGGMDLGTQPTVSSGKPRRRAEVHLLGFREGLYGRRIIIRLLKYLRPEIKFRNLVSLRRRIRKDILYVSRMKIPLK